MLLGFYSPPPCTTRAPAAWSLLGAIMVRSWDLVLCECRMTMLGNSLLMCLHWRRSGKQKRQRSQNLPMTLPPLKKPISQSLTQTHGQKLRGSFKMASACNRYISHGGCLAAVAAFLHEMGKWYNAPPLCVGQQRQTVVYL